MLKKSRYVAFNLQILSGNKQSIWDWIAELRYQIKDVIIWKKQAVAQIQKGKTATGYEYIYMLGNNDKMTFDYNNFPDNNYVPNIQEWTDMSYIKGHHATFPLQVPAFFINYFSKPNDLILDPFAGSGTTLVAAKQLGRRYIGIEISEEYCKIARERLKQEELELK